MPEIGDIRRGVEVGHKHIGKYSWTACEICGWCRWVRLGKGKPISTRCKSCVQKGHHHSKETRAKIGIGSKGHIVSSEMRAKIGAAQKGRRASAETRAKLSVIRKGRYCGAERYNWKGGNIRRTCLECGKGFYTAPSRIKHGRGKFCSQSCHMIYLRKQGYFAKSPNKPEQVLISLFTERRLPFKYTGNGDVWFGNRNPDFINTNGKKQVIELLGTYWHPLFDGANRTQHYKQYGFNTLIIWEDELKDMSKVLLKVKKFTRA